MLKEQLKQFNPFDLQDSKLQDIFTGISADNSDVVNCDQAEQYGFEIQCSLDNIVVNQTGQNPCDFTTRYQSQW